MIDVILALAILTVMLLLLYSNRVQRGINRRLVEVNNKLLQLLYNLIPAKREATRCVGCTPNSPDDQCPEHGFEAYRETQQAGDGHRWG